MNHKKFALILFGMFLLHFPVLAQAQGLVGVWSGTARQAKPNNVTFPMRMQLNGSTGSIDYPTLGCGADLSFIAKQGEGFAYRSHITSGQGKCIDGVIGVVPKGNALYWDWRGSGYSASATLTGTTQSVKNTSCSKCDADRENDYAGCKTRPTLQEQAACDNKAIARYIDCNANCQR